MDRRVFFLGAGAVVAGAGALWRWLSQGPGEDAAASVDPEPPPRARFPEIYRKNLEALCDRLVPSEPHGTGALGAGAWSYIERELSRPDMQGTYRLAMRGAAQMDRVARSTLGTTFLSATPEGRDQVIGALLAGEGTIPLFDSQRFVETMLGLTLEGMFGDPKHGGNTDEKGWQWLGYAMRAPRPTCH